MRVAVPRWLTTVDDRVLALVRSQGLLLLRIALALVFIWFGLLKVVDQSPVSDLVASSLSFLPARAAVVLMGFVEVVIGLGLLTGLALRVTLLLFVLQMLGTFGTMALQPETVFRNGNPLLLTTEGEFILKNIVLIAAGLVILAGLRRAAPDRSLTSVLTERPRPGMAEVGGEVAGSADVQVRSGRDGHPR